MQAEKTSTITTQQTGKPDESNKIKETKIDEYTAAAAESENLSTTAA